MPNFGNETKETEQDASYDYIIGSWYPCPEEGNAESITVYLKQYGTDTPKVKCAIYKKSDNSLVGYTEEWTLTAGWDDWKTFNIVWGGALEATDYYLVFWASTLPNKIKYCADLLSGKGATQNVAYNSFPNPWEPSTTNKKISIYCTYSTEGPPEKWANGQIIG